MTTIIAVKDHKEGVIRFVSDHLSTCGGRKISKSAVKVFKHGDMTIGVAGEMMTNSVIRDKIAPRKTIVEFTDVLRKTLHDNNLITTKDNMIEMHNSILVAHLDKLYRVDCNTGYLEVDRFDAVGSGSEFAIGALEALLGEGVSVWRAVGAAIGVAHQHDCYTGDVFTTVIHKMPVF